MGAYLSSPATETRSEDFTDSEKFSFGVSRMQGWRISMEDAHNCVPNVTDDNSLFGVYDGHGGSEVALYCALHFSDTLKDLESYQAGNYETALKETFMAIDKELLKPEVVRELKVLADRELDDAPPTKDDIDNAEVLRQDEEECEEDEMAMLHEEATMSIEELLSRYGKIASATNKALSKAKPVKTEATSSSSQSNNDSETSCSSSSSASITKKPAASSNSDNKVHCSTTEDAARSSNTIIEPQSKSESSSIDVSSSSSMEQPGSSNQDTVSKSSSKSDSECATPGISDQPCPSSSSNISSSSVTTSNDTAPKKSIATDNQNVTAEQSCEISCSDSAKKNTTGEHSSGVDSCSSSEVSKKVMGKINPKAKTQVKFGIGDDGDFKPELSGSESEDDGFDSDEAVEGSSESDEEESEEEESDDEDPDDVGIPPLKAMASTSEEPGKDSGTTAVVALLNKHNLYVANAGDSRCVICRNGAAFDMSEDHKPEDPEELSRIKAAGGYVAGGRVNGGLNLSRAIGDHCYKLNEKFVLENQIISAMPDVKKVTLQKGDQFMILACDGIWNTLSSQEVVDFVLAKLDVKDSDEKPKLSFICEELMRKCLAPDTSGDGTGCDNMTCIIVKFDDDWLAKSPCVNNAGDHSTINVKTEDGSGEAVNNQKANGSNDTEDTKAASCLKRHMDDTDNCDYPNSEAKIFNEFMYDGELICLPFCDAFLRDWWSAPSVGMGIAEEDKRRFPIRTIDEFIELFQSHVQRSVEEESAPNLAFLSILLGYLENELTLTDQADHHASYTDSMSDSTTPQHPSHVADEIEEISQSSQDIERNDEDDFPVLELNVVEGLYLKFSILVKSRIDRTSTENTTRSGYATKFLCKKVSDVIWNRLHPHYHTDKAHIQSLFSFLTGKKLDCFGHAFVVIAACQIMKYGDVHLGMSEDHAWATHGDNNKEMTEITWHGKGTEDKRGWPLEDTDIEKSWMYLSGHGILCTRIMEVAAMVVAINPSIDYHTDSETMYTVQRKLLNFMYKLGALDKYPLGLCLLAEFENSDELYQQAVDSCEMYYDGSHVFPYCFQGQFYSKNGKYKEAISCWSKAAHVLTRYNYTREDEEVYREIMDIAKEYIPLAMKSDPTICEDRNCFLELIKFYDGICLWEEDSSTPVLHSWWAKYFTNTLGRFSAEVRETFRTSKDDEKINMNHNQATPTVKHSLRKEDRSSLDKISEDEDTITSVLGVKSSKMKGLEDLLIGSKKFSTHTVSLQLTAQSQVHLSRKRQSIGNEGVTGYSGRIKKPKKFFE